jgi:type II secretory pathway pseudopilin PulG
MDWLAAFVIVAIIGQYALIKWLIHKHERRLEQAQRAQRAGFLEAAAKQQQKTFLNNTGSPND